MEEVEGEVMGDKSKDMQCIEDALMAASVDVKYKLENCENPLGRYFAARTMEKIEAALAVVRREGGAL